MLVLSRKCDEEILIGADITVMIVSIEGGRVGVGITAPREVDVDRKEIRQRKLATA